MPSYYVPHGVIPAVLLPFNEDLSIGSHLAYGARPPLVKLSSAEIARIRQALVAAGLRGEGARAKRVA